MNSAMFFVDVKRRASRKCAATDPLAEARRILQGGGLTAEGQMLRRAVKALAVDAGEFGDADVHRLGSDALALVSALVEARTTRRYTDAEWLTAGAIGE